MSLQPVEHLLLKKNKQQSRFTSEWRLVPQGCSTCNYLTAEYCLPVRGSLAQPGAPAARLHRHFNQHCCRVWNHNHPPCLYPQTTLLLFWITQAGLSVIASLCSPFPHFALQLLPTHLGLCRYTDAHSSQN